MVYSQNDLNLLNEQFETNAFLRIILNDCAKSAILVKDLKFINTLKLFQYSAKTEYKFYIIIQCLLKLHIV